MMIKRHIKARMIDLLNDFRIVYLTGPRQAGKSTLVREIAKDRFLHGVLFYSGDKALPFRINGRIFHALPISSLFPFPSGYEP